MAGDPVCESCHSCVTPSYACRPSLYILWALYLSVKENLGNLARGFAGGGFSALWRHGNGMMADGDRAEDKQKDERRGRRRGPAQNISAADPPVGAGAWLCHCECARKCTSTPRGIPVRHACCQHCSRFLIQKRKKSIVSSSKSLQSVHIFQASRHAGLVWIGARRQARRGMLRPRRR
jgi:hypothetical protein